MNKRQREYEESLHGTIMDLMPQIVLHIDPIIHSDRFQGMKISDNQIKVIMLLHHVKRASPGFISRHLNIQKGSLTAIIKSLRKLGMIDRENDEEDERSYRLSLSRLGEEFANEHLGRCDRELRGLLEGMKEAERNEVKNGLRVLIRHLEARGEINEKPRVR